IVIEVKLHRHAVANRTSRDFRRGRAVTQTAPIRAKRIGAHTLDCKGDAISDRRRPGKLEGEVGDEGLNIDPGAPKEAARLIYLARGQLQTAVVRVDGAAVECQAIGRGESITEIDGRRSADGVRASRDSAVGVS